MIWHVLLGINQLTAQCAGGHRYTNEGDNLEWMVASRGDESLLQAILNNVIHMVGKENCHRHRKTYRHCGIDHCLILGSSNRRLILGSEGENICSLIY